MSERSARTFENSGCPGFRDSNVDWIAVVRWFLFGAGAMMVVVGSNLCGAESATADAKVARTGKEIFEACLLCHSTKEMQRGPILDGLPEWYVARQLRKFKSGVRGSLPKNRSAALMAEGMSALQDEEEIERVAAYISDLPPQSHLLVIRGDADLGKTVYMRCIPCHGLGAEGNPLIGAPPINMMEDWYLLGQLRKFRKGLRGHDIRDAQGKLMAPGVLSLKDKDFRNVVRYITEELAESPPLKRSQPFKTTLTQ